MIVWEGIAANGVKVRIDDAYCAPRGSELERQIIEEQRQVAYEILLRAAQRKAAQQGMEA